MEKTEIKAVEMIRQIRAQHAEELRDATPDERILFYRKKAARLGLEAEALRQAQRASA